VDYELRIVVEKVAVSSQEVVKRDTIKIYDIQRPESILDLGLRHRTDILAVKGAKCIIGGANYID